MQPTKQDSPPWIEQACNHAADYLIRFVNNPGVERIVVQFEPRYAHIESSDERLDELSRIAAEHWDFRKGRERYEVVANEPMDQEGSELGKIILEGENYAEMISRSSATLRHYDIVGILGGANKSPYYRLRYALDQKITYGKLIFLGCERRVEAPEAAQVIDYAPGAQTEYDLGKSAIKTLFDAELVEDKEHETIRPTWREAYFQKNDGTPLVVLSAPPLHGRKRASTSDTYEFLLQIEGKNIGPHKSILFVTSAVYRYAQYFDAVREILLKTGANIETIGYEPAYSGLDFKPSKALQELKSAVDAAVQLRDAMKTYRPGNVLVIK